MRSLAILGSMFFFFISGIAWAYVPTTKDFKLDNQITRCLKITMNVKTIHDDPDLPAYQALVLNVRQLTSHIMDRCCEDGVLPWYQIISAKGEVLQFLPLEYAHSKGLVKVTNIALNDYTANSELKSGGGRPYKFVVKCSMGP